MLGIWFSNPDKVLTMYLYYISWYNYVLGMLIVDSDVCVLYIYSIFYIIHFDIMSSSFSSFFSDWVKILDCCIFKPSLKKLRNSVGKVVMSMNNWHIPTEMSELIFVFVQDINIFCNDILHLCITRDTLNTSQKERSH